MLHERRNYILCLLVEWPKQLPKGGPMNYIKMFQETTSEQIDKMSELMVQHLETTELKNKEYFSSPTYERHYRLVKEFVSEHESLEDNAYNFQLDPILSNEEFCHFVYVTMEMHRSLVTSDTSSDFEAEILNLNNEMELMKVHGQGTAYFVRKRSDPQK